MSDSARRGGLTYGKVTGGQIGPHTLVQVTGLDGVVMNTVALLHPFGFWANPPDGADVALFQVLGSSDHVLALGGGMAGTAPALAQGEFALSYNGQTVAFRNGGTVEVTGATAVTVTAGSEITLTAPNVNVAGNLHVTGGNITVGGITVAVP